MTYADVSLWKRALRVARTCLAGGCLMGLMACASAPGASAPPDALPRARAVVMSYNIRCGSCERADDVNHWSRRKFLVAQMIARSGADLIGMQEAERFQVQDLVQLLDGYDWVGVGRDGGERGEMNAVLVRRAAWRVVRHETVWLSQTPDRVSKGWDAMFPRTLAHLELAHVASGATLHWLNSHFDHMGAEARVQSAAAMARLAQRLSPGTPLVVTGDFNDRPGSPVHQTLAATLRDAAQASLTPHEGGDISFNGFGLEIEPGNTIDYVFVTPSVRVRSHRLMTELIDGRYPSDHYPLVVQIELP